MATTTFCFSGAPYSKKCFDPCDLHYKHVFIINIYYISLRYADAFLFLAVAFCLFSFFPTYMERTLTTLLSFHWMAAIIKDIRTATFEGPLSIFPTLSTDLRGELSIGQVRTVPVTVIDFSGR